MEIENSIQAFGRDPWITRHRDTYFYCFTDAPHNRKLFVASSKTISGLSNAPAMCVWQAPEDGPYAGHYWAPELHMIEGKWYIYVAAGKRRSEEEALYSSQRIHVFAAISSNPQGEYRYVGKISDSNDRFAIDGTPFTYRGKKYFIWSGWEGVTNYRQVLYIAVMKNPFTLLGEGIKISTPEYEWERRSQPYVPGGVNEGPQVLKHKNKLHILYSASGSWTDHYCLGKLTLAGDNPLDPSLWHKDADPVFASSESLFAPGHACFVRDSQKGQHYIVYHASTRRGAGWDTKVRAQEFSWSPDHTPLLGYPR